MKNYLKILIVFLVGVIIGGVCVYLIFGNKENNNSLEPLPAQEKSEGLRGIYDIDKNINDETIDNYLGRSDVVYRDLRMLEDTATWENKGGERDLTGFIKGFEVVPYPYLTEFPQAYIDQKESENVHNLYQGKTLFRLDDKGNYIANYKESMDILEYLFPKDKTIFLICGAGGYANFTKQMLGALGWDTSKIYNLGGYWYYNGKNAISTKVEGSDKCDFSKVPYHNIDFSRLTEVK
jgi:rhodanese-related sulfurtransferase